MTIAEFIRRQYAAIAAEGCPEDLAPALYVLDDLAHEFLGQGLLDLIAPAEAA